MKRTLFLLFIVVTGITPPSKAIAGEDKVTHSFSLAQGIGFPIALSDPHFGSPPSVSEGLRINWKRQSSPLGWMGEAAVGTSFTSFTPSLILIAGPGYPMGEKAAITARASWKFTPEYGETPSAQTVGLSVAPVFSTSFGSVGLSVGVACTPNAEMTCGASVGLKTAFRIFK